MNVSTDEIVAATFSVNGRDYRPPTRPIAIICIDGCADEYLSISIAKGAMPNLAKMLERSNVVEHDGHAKDVEMIQALVTAQQTVAATLAAAGEVAANHGDTLTEDLCIARGQVHEKFAWILLSHLG